MNYTEVDFLIAPLEPWRDILLAELGELGYDSFVETTGGLKAYILSERFERKVLPELLALRDPHASVSYTVRAVDPKNWNAEWERSFTPVEVGTDVRIRADFHEPAPGFTYDLIITPRMAFGTGHHATTRMMVQAMMGLDLKGQAVCDLGSGTAVLAVLAEKRGATDVLAIDIDALAEENALENVERNGCHAITVEKGTVADLKGRMYGIILANIERNTLMRDMDAMRDALLPGGALLLSGFVVGDRHMMIQCAKEAGLLVEERMNEGEWALIGCRKPLN